jgi:hypothetical protein
VSLAETSCLKTRLHSGREVNNEADLLLTLQRRFCLVCRSFLGCCQ